jgi:hypothetical protein
MRTLNILICGGDDPALKRIAKTFADEGTTVATSTEVIDSLCFSHKEWDFLLVDLDGLSSFLRSLLPAVCRKFPNLPIVGISTKSAADINTMGLGYGLELDDYLFDTPHTEDLIVRFPQVAAKFLVDTKSLAAADPLPLPI